MVKFFEFSCYTLDIAYFEGISPFPVLLHKYYLINF